jgi:D-tyrosyl-tRNA(Tyr) deacylase
MRAVVQRVTHADVVVDGEVVASIGIGILVLVGAVDSDGDTDAVALAKKLVSMRVFADAEGKMNRSIVDIDGSILIVSQFTLLADIRKGRRPSFTGAAAPDHAEPLVDTLTGAIASEGVRVETGRFGAMMNVSLTNSGPVTFVIDVAKGRVV